MAINDMAVNFNSAQLLASIVGQATGVEQITPVDGAEFVSVAQTGLKAGYDPLMTAISQVLSKTIFSIRPYTAKFRGLMMDGVRWGNHVRKLNVIDGPIRDADRYDLTNDAHAVDMFDVCKPEIVQTNIYGFTAFDKCVTIYRDQLDVAFSSPEEFDRFVSMIMQNASDQIEQTREEMARGTIANLITGVYAQVTEENIAPERVVYLVSEYNTATGSSLDADTVLLPQNFPAFARWLFGFLKTLSNRLTNRTAAYHQPIGSGDDIKYIMRHTPIERQKLYLYGPLINTISSNVLSTVFYDKFLKLADHEEVDYWQSFNDPMSIEYTPVYTDADGAVVTEENPVSVELDNVFGVIFDEEAAGIRQYGEWSAIAPFEARGGYTNYWFHYNIQHFNDFSENAVVLLLDTNQSGD